MDVAYELMPEPDWASTTTIRVADGHAADAAAWAREIFDRRSVPVWGQALFGLREVAARVLRIPPGKAEMLTVSSVRDGVAVIDTPDKHLHFVATVSAEAHFVHVTTAVSFTGAVGRAYFLPVRFVHDLLTRSMMQAAAGRIARRASGRDHLAPVG